MINRLVFKDSVHCLFHITFYVLSLFSTLKFLRLFHSSNQFRAEPKNTTRKNPKLIYNNQEMTNAVYSPGQINLSHLFCQEQFLGWVSVRCQFFDSSQRFVMEFKWIPGRLVMKTSQCFISNLVKDCDVTKLHLRSSNVFCHQFAKQCHNMLCV